MSETNADPVLVDITDHVATLTLSRPETCNALNLEMADQLVDALITCDERTDIRAVVLTGAGRAFCSGGDINQMRDRSDDNGSGQYLRRLTVGLHAAIATIARMPKPVVTAVNGPAAGAGLSLALAGDMVVASTAARFTVAYTAIGLAPDGSSSYSLPRLIDSKRAYELIATNRSVDPAEALEFGMINKVIEPDRFVEEYQELATSLAGGPTVALGLAKSLLLSGTTGTLETAMELERRAIATCGSTVDFAEGSNAFSEKRAAAFIGS